MKRALIENNVKNSIELYNINNQPGSYNIPQSTKFPGVKMENNTYIFLNTDSRLEATNNFILYINLPEIKGIGSIRYPTYLIYKLINLFEIYIDDVLILSKTGIEFLWEFKKTHINPKLIGNIDAIMNFKEGFDNDDIIFNKMEICAPLITIFDMYQPKSVLRIPSDSKLTFKLTLKPLYEVLIYTKLFKTNSLDKYKNIDLKPTLSMKQYNTKNESISARYLEDTILIDGLINRKDNITQEFLSATNIIWYPKNTKFNKNTFISYPSGSELSEKVFIDCYKNRLLQDLIVVSSDEEFKKDYPLATKFKKIKSFDTFYHDTNNSTVIYIRNVPENYNVYFLTNILTFSRRKKENGTNISTRFKYVLGDYLAEENKILYIKIEHDLTIADVSVPVKHWNSVENTDYKDCRSEKSKREDVILYDPFILGMDFVGKNKGYKEYSIKAGNSDTIIDIDNNQSNYNHLFFKDTSYPVTHEISEYDTISLVSFNSNNSLISEPSRFKADEAMNIRYCTVLVTWDEVSQTNPDSLDNKYLTLGVTHLSKMEYVNEKIVVNKIS